LDQPSDEFKLSALYGAAGRNHDPELTKLLLVAGADPNDGESLYHSLENLDCTRLLLEAGARIEGSNALYRVLDLDNSEALKLLLAHSGKPQLHADITVRNEFEDMNAVDLRAWIAREMAKLGVITPGDLDQNLKAGTIEGECSEVSE
jgi:Ankyrin repeats (3 copies)